MVLMEIGTGIPLDLVIFINSFLPRKLTDNSFKEAIFLWFGNNQKKEKCKQQFGHISDWNTSRVTNMKSAFANRKDFDEDISRWDVSSVTNMSKMFRGADHFHGDLSCWNVANVTTMSEMFALASQFNGDLSHWDVGKVMKMGWMFAGAFQFNGDLSR
jgi:surface protein